MLVKQMCGRCRSCSLTKVLAHRKPKLLQEKLFEVVDVVLFIKQDNALLVLNFVHASVGEGAEVISKQYRVS